MSQITQKKAKGFVTKDDYQKIFGQGSVTPVPVKMEPVGVQVSGDFVFHFARAFIAECHESKPLFAAKDEYLPTEQEMIDYVAFILEQRILCVHGKCTLWRKLKQLWIPSWIQFCITNIGEVRLKEFGLVLTPEWKPTDGRPALTFEQALIISEKIGMYSDRLSMVRDGFPRSIDGDVEVMSMVVIDGQVRSFKSDNHPLFSYVSGFLNMRLVRETVFKSLYRMSYDDIELILSALRSERRIIASV